MLWDVDLNHQSSSHLHDHVKSLRVGDLGQWWHVGCKLQHVSMHFQEVVEAHHDELPDFHLPYFFKQLPEEGPPLRHFCHWLHHIDSFSGEVLMEVDATGVMDGPQYYLDVSLGHLPPVFDHQLLEWCDGGIQGIFAIIGQEVGEGLHYGIELVPVGLSFHWILWSRVGEVIIIRDINDFRLLWCHVTVLELAWGRSHTRVATSKTRQIMVFLVGTSAYIGSMTLICSPTPGQFFTPTNHHPAFTISGQFLGMVGRANIADQRKITCRHQLLVLCTCSCRGNIVEYSEMT